MSENETQDQDVAESFEAPKEKGGWLMKHAIGKSMFGRSNWKMRYVVANMQGISYFATEPFTTPKGVVLWDTVTLIYDTIDKYIDANASDPKKFYFGLRFLLSPGHEKVLLFSTDTEQDRKQWTDHLRETFAVWERVNFIVETDDDQNEDDERDVLDRMKAERRAQVVGTCKQSQWIKKISLKLRRLVSKKKQRYQEGGVDLDLAYITPQMIAMGYPAEGREAYYRNPMCQVTAFFDSKHHGKYKIYNLCSERSYPPNRFHGRFARFPFDDHNPSPLELLIPLCRDVEEFLFSDPDIASKIGDISKATSKEKFEASSHVVSLHCKAGKGRTGLVCCCLLLYFGICPDAASALQMFGERRTKDGKGVQIPSQRRYIYYFDELLKKYNGICPPPTPFLFLGISASSCPLFDPQGGCDPYVIVEQRKKDHQHLPIGQKEGVFKNPMETVFDSRKRGSVPHVTENFNVDVSAVLCGELRFTLWDQDTYSKDDPMLTFWIHTSMLPMSSPLVLTKNELDDAVKDKKNHIFPQDFVLSLNYHQT